PGLGTEPERDRLESLAGAAARRRPPGRAAGGPGPDTRGLMGRRPPRGDVRPRRARGARAARLPEDVWVARDPRAGADRAALDVHRGAARRARTGARGGAPAARQGHLGVVEGAAPWRVHRLQPERQGPD